MVKMHVGLAGDGARKQRFAGAATTRSTPRGMRPPSRWNLPDRAKFDDLLQIELGFVDAGDVLEGDAAMRLAKAWRGSCRSQAPCRRRLASGATGKSTPDQRDERQPRYSSDTNHGTLSLSGRAVIDTPLL